MAGYPVSRACSHSEPGSYVLHQSRDRLVEMTGIGHGPNLVVSSLSAQILRDREPMKPDKVTMVTASSNAFRQLWKAGSGKVLHTVTRQRAPDR
jgi:major membrane immunogen (membrane-anchored lipoprotein)